MQQLFNSIKKVVKENPEYFEALVEFEKTGKLPKLNYKKRVNFTINEDLIRKFRTYCEKRGCKMSTKIEQLIRKELNSENTKVI